MNPESFEFIDMINGPMLNTADGSIISCDEVLIRDSIGTIDWIYIHMYPLI